MSTKMKIEKYDCDANFSLWQIKMKVLITQQGLKKALFRVDKMPTMMTKKEKTEMDEKALSLIQLNLSNEVLQEVSQETTTTGLWLKLENLYKMKTLASKLHLKQRLYLQRMSEGTSVKSHIYQFS